MIGLLLRRVPPSPTSDQRPGFLTEPGKGGPCRTVSSRCNFSFQLALAHLSQEQARLPTPTTEYICKPSHTCILVLSVLLCYLDRLSMRCPGQCRPNDPPSLWRPNPPCQFMLSGFSLSGMTRSCSRAHGGLTRHCEDISSSAVDEMAQANPHTKHINRSHHQSG